MTSVRHLWERYSHWRPKFRARREKSWPGFVFFNSSSRAPQPPAAPTAPPAALKRESAHQARRRAKPIGADMIALSVTIPSAFEEIDWMVRNIEHAALIVAGLLALACVACEWRA
jgi:hypothetical protein